MDPSGDRSTARLLLPASVRRLPADLAVILALTAATAAAVTVPVLRDTALRAVVGVPFVLFVPGYLVVSALFPERADSDGGPNEEERGLSNLARFALSFPASVMVVVPLALLTVFSPWGLQTATVVPLLVAFVLGTIAVIVRRRDALPTTERFRPPFGRWVRSARAGLSGSPADAALNVVLAVSLLVASVAVVYTLAVPPPGEGFTELALSPTDDRQSVPNGTIRLSADESESLRVSVDNREGERVRYTLAVVRQRVRVNGDSVTVLDSAVEQRFRPVVASDRTWNTTFTVSPGIREEMSRVAFLLYRDEVPETPTIENAYRRGTLFVNTTA